MGRPRTRNFHLPAGVRIIGTRYYWQATSAAHRKVLAAAGEPVTVALGPIGEETEMRRRWAALQAKYPSHSLPVAQGLAAVPDGGSLVYFLRAGRRGSVKIGFSSSATSLAKRVALLQVANAEKIKLIGAVLGTRADEKTAHFELRHHRMSGEWFASRAAVTSYIKHALTLGRIPGAWATGGPIVKRPEIVKEKDEETQCSTGTSGTPR